jgi:hypothetical protein
MNGLLRQAFLKMCPDPEFQGKCALALNWLLLKGYFLKPGSDPGFGKLFKYQILLLKLGPGAFSGG